MKKRKRVRKQFFRFITGGLVLAGVFFVSLPSQPARAACSALPTDQGVVTATLTVATAGEYTVWSRVLAPDSANNSYYLQIDEDHCKVVVGDTEIPANNYTWIDFKSGNANDKLKVNLSAGAHTFKMAGREAGVQLDKIMLLATACVPTGLGDNCGDATAADNSGTGLNPDGTPITTQSTEGDGTNSQPSNAFEALTEDIAPKTIEAAKKNPLLAAAVVALALAGLALAILLIIRHKPGPLRPWIEKLEAKLPWVKKATAVPQPNEPPISHLPGSWPPPQQ